MIAALFLSTAFADPSGTATVPVEQLLALQRPAPEAPPPVPGAIEAVVLDGRVLDDALELDVSVTASVLGHGWTELPILDLGPDAEVAPIDAGADAWVVVRDRTLVLLSEKPGRYAFDVHATLPAAHQGAQRTVRVGVRPATSARMGLRHDPEQVRVASGDTVRPKDGGYTVSWTVQGDRTPIAAVPKPAAEPVVERATASIVSTLEGTWLARTHLDLRFEGQRTLTLGWPDDQQLERVWLNGAPIEAELVDGALVLDVAPARGGGDRATVEIVSTRERTGYLLRGTVDLQLPSVSWPVREWVCALHLPEVFDYAWQGGSLVASDAPPPASDLFSYRVPTPGEVSVWHQELVFAVPPTLRLGYTVELEGAYFRPPVEAMVYR